VSQEERARVEMAMNQEMGKYQMLAQAGFVSYNLIMRL